MPESGRTSLSEHIQHLSVPLTFDEAMDPRWLSQALASLTGGAPVTGVEVVEKIVTVATKVRFRVEWEGGSASLCLKSYLDRPLSGNNRAVEEEFYRQIAPHLPVRLPDCLITLIDPVNGHSAFIMRDLVAEGAVFNSALDAFTPDQMKSSLEQLALLHSSHALLERLDWVKPKIEQLISWQIVTLDKLQELLDGPRGVELDATTRNARLLTDALGALAGIDKTRPATLVHGDFHAGNSYRTKDGTGMIDWSLIQRGGWALDVAYHMAAALPVEVAEAHEWDLLDHYLERARSLGAVVPDREEAQEHYRTAMVYGYYLWAVTTRVLPEITHTFVDRQGKAVMRHETFRRLGVA